MEIPSQPMLEKSNYSILFRYITITGFIAGSLDALAAIFILSHGNAPPIFKFIASGIYGKEAFNSGGDMILLGIALHYFIAYTFTVYYFIISGYFYIFCKNVFLRAFIYGLFIYLVMNIIVLSYSNVTIPHRTIIGVVKNVVILTLCVSSPIVYFNRLYYLRTVKKYIAF
jgi:hypothetical protein